MLFLSDIERPPFFLTMETCLCAVWDHLQLPLRIFFYGVNRVETVVASVYETKKDARSEIRQIRL